MTAEPSFAADRSDDAGRSDLSSAFGRPATSSLRGLLPPRPRRSAEEIDPDPVDAAPTEESPEETAPETAAEAAAETVEEIPDEAAEDAAVAPPVEPPTVPAPRARPARAPAATGVANRRWGSVRVTAQEHVELLVLVALRRGPADGRELAERLRDDSAGALAPPPTTVQRTLRHLARHELVERVDTDPRRFRLTELGTRIARARVRAWRGMRRAVDAVVDASGDA